MASFRAFVLPDLTGVIVHDRYYNYDSPEFAGVRHQLCCQHLLRDLADAAENYPGEDPAEDLRPPPLRKHHPPPVRHTWLHLHRWGYRISVRWTIRTTVGAEAGH